MRSGLGFGFLFGVGQAAVWLYHPYRILLPLAGSVVGYATNWVAIKLVFEPVEPVDVLGMEVQGLFEKRQPEVSDAFAAFLRARVLTSLAVGAKARGYGGHAPCPVGRTTPPYLSSHSKYFSPLTVPLFLPTGSSD